VAKEDKQYKVNWLLDHNGKKYEAGDKVALSAEDAKVLLAAGVIGESKKEGE
jgi:hypothetical protein